MSFDWSDYLQLAQDIKDDPSSSEAQKRTAISRAYYAAHNLARDLAIQNGHPNTPNNGHSSLISFFKRDFSNVQYQEAGKLLSTLRFERTKCDYNSDTTAIGDIDAKLESAIIQANGVRQHLGV